MFYCEYDYGGVYYSSWARSKPNHKPNHKTRPDKPHKTKQNNPFQNTKKRKKSQKPSPKLGGRKLAGASAKGGEREGRVAPVVGNRAGDNMILTGNVEDDADHLIKFCGLILPVCSYLVEAECGEEHDIKTRKNELSAMNFKFEGFRGKLYKRKSMVESMCDAFKTGIGPVGRERRTRMMLLLKKTGSRLLGQGTVGGGAGTRASGY